MIDKKIYESIKKKFKTFNNLKNAFFNSIFLIYFSINLDFNIIKLIFRTFIKLILFLNRMLNIAENNY